MFELPNKRTYHGQYKHHLSTTEAAMLCRVTEVHFKRWAKHIGIPVEGTGYDARISIKNYNLLCKKSEVRVVKKK